MQATAAVLAAGAATRFGATKQVAQLDGQPLIAHAVNIGVAAGCDPVHVVVGHDADRVVAALPDTALVVVNPRHAEGQATSLHAAVRAAQETSADVLVVLLADEPLVDADVVRRVIAACRDGAEVARAVYSDRAGHPVAFVRRAWSELLRASGDEGARSLLDAFDVRELQVDALAPIDVDTPDRLDEVREGRRD